MRILIIRIQRGYYHSRVHSQGFSFPNDKSLSIIFWSIVNKKRQNIKILTLLLVHYNSASLTKYTHRVPKIVNVQIERQLPSYV